MNSKSKQNWEIGNAVKVGFLSLTVLDKAATPGDYRPDAYLLQSSKGDQYSFIPHHGLQKMQPGENFRALAASGQL